MTYSEQMSIAVARKVHKRWCRERTPCEYGAEDMAVARDILDGLVAAGFEARVSAERSDQSEPSCGSAEERSDDPSKSSDLGFGFGEVS